MNFLQEFSIKQRFQSFVYAFKGLSFMLRSQHNAWLHLMATIITVLIALWLEVSREDWRWIIVAITMVWFAETINTAFEYVCDLISPDFHHSVEKAKDIAAGAVLICAVGAAIIGVVTFLPLLIVKFN